MKPYSVQPLLNTAALSALLFAGIIRPVTGADDFGEKIAPFTKAYCVKCHNSQEAKGDLNLSRYERTDQLVADFRHWKNVVEFIRGGEMPPDDARQPSLAERESVVEAIEGVLLAEAKKHAGDPGIVLPRRLSNTEYDLSIRDLTGVDIRPTSDFPADPAAGEGFDNTGEALSMSPNLLKKYLAAAQRVSNHLVLKTDGITFAPFPVTSYNERKKLTEQAIIDFYRDHDVRIVDYLESAWRYRHRKESDRNVSIAAWAQRSRLSAKYLGLVWETLQSASSSTGYLKQVGDQWNAVPSPSSEDGVPQELASLDRLIEFCRGQLYERNEQLIRANAGTWPIGQLDMRAKKAAMRDRFDSGVFRNSHLVQFNRLQAPKNEGEAKDVTLSLRIDPGIGGGKGNYVLLRRPLFSKSNKLPRNEEDEKKNEVVTLKSFLEQHAPDIAKRLAFGTHPKGHAIDPDVAVIQAPAVIEITLTPAMLKQLDQKHLLVQCELDPEHGRDGSVHVQHATGRKLDDPNARDVVLLIDRQSELATRLTESNERFCRTFPNRFLYVHNERGLAAGFHLVEGFFRDDQPLVQKVLDKRQLQHLDQLWEELEFVTQSVETLLRGFVWFERSERHVLHDERFDFLRAEDPRLVEDGMLTRFEKLYLEKLGVKLVEDSLKPENPSDKYDMIHGFFEGIRARLKHRGKLLQSAEQLGLRDLESLAQRALHRSLRPQEAESLRKLYQLLREQNQGVEAALRGVFTAILMSPDFCYRFTETPAGSGVHPLGDGDLASRLSYFLWSSLPDKELLESAGQGQLQNEAQLLAQTQRMLKDPRISSFAREFLGQWLRYRDYLDNDSINADTFRDYNDPLRQAMFDEPVQLATYLIQQDRPITDLLNTDTTFVNGVLAKHYGGAIAGQYRDAVSKWTAEQRRRGIPEVTKPEEVWHQVDGLREAGRGGLFGMGVILTKNSAGERTSPVKRGFWTVHHLLGKHFPPPPADVPELPPGEKEAKKTIRELIAEHTADAKCAICHVHFDAIGMAMEGFDPIGRARTKDLAGRVIDNVSELPNGETAEGIPGLIDYIEHHRKQDFVRTLCRKFLGYALGRSVVLSDQPLLHEMESNLAKSGYRFSVLFTTVVSSPQFRKQRGREFVADRN